MTSWHAPYGKLLEIAGAATQEELARLWHEHDGDAQIKALQRRTFSFKRSPYGRLWHGERKAEKTTVRSEELREALRQLHLRINDNPVLQEPQAIARKGAILDCIAGITVWNNRS
jgi:hypothetical protein